VPLSAGAVQIEDFGQPRLFFRRNKYNPIYNLWSMNAARETDKLEARGNMTNKKNACRTESEDQDALSTSAETGSYEIHVRGQLDESWSDWLEGLELQLIDNGEMILYGHIPDQAALMGILNKLYGLNLTLLSVNGMKKH
jgi:hypothetical protein